MGIISSNDALTINGKRIAYKSNTLSPKGGKATGTIQTASKGGGLTSKDLSIDDSTNFDGIEFELNNTPENRLLRDEWIQKLNNQEGVVIEIGSDSVFKEMFFTGENAEDRKHEGTIKIKFEGGI